MPSLLSNFVIQSTLNAIHTGYRYYQAAGKVRALSDFLFVAGVSATVMYSLQSHSPRVGFTVAAKKNWGHVKSSDIRYWAYPDQVFQLAFQFDVKGTSPRVGISVNFSDLSKSSIQAGTNLRLVPAKDSAAEKFFSLDLAFRAGIDLHANLIARINLEASMAKGHVRAQFPLIALGGDKAAGEA